MTNWDLEKRFELVRGGTATMDTCGTLAKRISVHDPMGSLLWRVHVVEEIGANLPASMFPFPHQVAANALWRTAKRELEISANNALRVKGKTTIAPKETP